MPTIQAVQSKHSSFNQMKGGQHIAIQMFQVCGGSVHRIDVERITEKSVIRTDGKIERIETTWHKYFSNEKDAYSQALYNTEERIHQEKIRFNSVMEMLNRDVENANEHINQLSKVGA